MFREGEEVVTHALSGPKRNGKRGTVLRWLPDQQRHRPPMTAFKVLALAHHHSVAAPNAKATAAMAPFSPYDESVAVGGMFAWAQLRFGWHWRPLVAVAAVRSQLWAPMAGAWGVDFK